MKTCHDVDVLMTAFVDAAISADETADVEAHLETCADCRERAEIERTAREVVRRRAAQLGEPAPAGLRARCVAATPELGARGVIAVGPAPARPAPQPPTGWRPAAVWVPFSMAAAVVLAVGAILFFGQQSNTAFAAQLALDHDRCFSDRAGLDPAFDQRAAETRVAAELGRAVALPEEGQGFDVLDVRRCLYDEGQMAHVLCEWNGQPVSLFVVPERSDSEEQIEIVRHDAVIWSQNGTGFVLVAEHGSDEIAELVDYVQTSLE